MIWGDERGQVRALIYALVVIGAVVASVAIARADTVIDEGSAAYYAPSYDNGGWDRIIARHAAWGQLDMASFPYSADGYWCVRPGTPLGTQLTLTNPTSGASLTCTVADSVAVSDQPYWWRHFVVELSYRAWEALGLAQGNDVVVSA